MRPPRAIPLLLTFITLALPASAQIKANAGADASAGTSGQSGASLNSGGVAPIGLSGSGQLSPLSLSGSLAPALSAPAASLNQGLAPSALQAAARPAAAAEAKPAAQAASATPPKTPPSIGPTAAPASPPMYCSRQPLLPQWHSMPVKAIEWCPSSHEELACPRMIRPLAT